MIKSPLLRRSLLLTVGLATASTGLAQSLQEAVQAAMVNNPDVRFAATHRWTTEEQLKEKKAAFLPTLDLAAGEGFQNTNNPTTASAGTYDIGLTRGESSLTLDENLFAGFGQKSEVDRLKQTVNSAAFKTAGTAEDTALKVVEKYLEVLRDQNYVSLAEKNVGVHKNILGMIDERTEAGVSRKADSDQASGRYSLAEANVVAEKGNLTDAQSNFMRLVGEAPTHLKMPVAPKNAQLPSTLDQAIAEALENHPTLKSANADIAAAKAQYTSSKANNYPRVDLVLSATRNDNIDGQPGVSNDEKAMVRGTWNLFNGGADVAKRRTAASQIQEAIDTRNRTIVEIQENMRLSWNAWKEAESRSKYLKDHRDLSEKTLLAYQEQFKLGQRTLLDTLDSQNEYYQANIDYVNSQYTELYARYRVMNAMGRLMDYVGVARPVESNMKMPKGTKPVRTQA